jgi:Protein of unknown function with PCYCGC motif
MKTRFLLIILVILALGAAVVVMMKPQGAKEIAQEAAGPTVVADNTTPAVPEPTAPRVPAFQSAVEAGNLPKTLPASQFVGKAREAYEVAKKIPGTLAQLPCYCECDRGFGHKSLHTCFVDDHASGCAVCVDEALLAYKLEKEQKLSPEQVREKIIEQYSSTHAGHHH